MVKFIQLSVFILLFSNLAYSSPSIKASRFEFPPAVSVKLIEVLLGSRTELARWLLVEGETSSPHYGQCGAHVYYLNRQSIHKDVRNSLICRWQNENDSFGLLELSLGEAGIKQFGSRFPNPDRQWFSFRQKVPVEVSRSSDQANLNVALFNAFVRHVPFEDELPPDQHSRFRKDDGLVKPLAWLIQDAWYDFNPPLEQLLKVHGMYHESTKDHWVEALFVHPEERTLLFSCDRWRYFDSRAKRYVGTYDYNCIIGDGL